MVSGGPEIKKSNKTKTKKKSDSNEGEGSVAREEGEGVGGGDALDDNLLLEEDWIDNETTAADVGEQVDGVKAGTALEGCSDEDELEAKEEEERPRKKKRKVDSSSEAKAEKKPQHTLSDDMWNKSMARQPTYTQLQTLTDCQKKVFPGISSMELDEIELKEEYILDLSECEQWMDMAGMIKQGMPETLDSLAKVPKVNGTPRMIIVASSALRAIAIAREIRDLAGKSKVGQLFAKHHSVTDHATWVKSTGINMVVGTPDRLRKLVEMHALALTSTAYLVLDVTYRDAKQQSLVDVPDLRKVLFGSLLCDKAVLERLQSGKMKLVFA